MVSAVEICRKFDDFVGRIAGEISAVPRQVQSLFSCTLPADRSNPDIPFCRNNRKAVVPENLGCLELIKSHKGVPMQVCGATIGLMAAVVAAASVVADEPSGPMRACSRGSAEPVARVSWQAESTETAPGAIGSQGRGEPRVSVGALFAPIGSLKLHPVTPAGTAPAAAEAAPALDELISKQLASDSGADYLGEPKTVPGGSRSRPLSAGRGAFAFHHQPLYFAQPALEESGESLVGLNPFITVGWFAMDVALLPVRLVTQPPCSKVRSDRD